ncbi:MAG: lamin tail domain-containing protein [Streptosporangiales bacterium]|nr:lamin tail domain-containing protein [Streptosporangiales bacterium]
MRLRYTVLAACSAIFLGGFLVITPAAEAAPAIRLGKIQYDPSGKDTRNNAQLNREYVVIKNVSGKARNLTGWRLRDRSNHVYKFGTFTLKARSSVTIHTGKGRNSAGHRYWGRGWYVWNNTGDKATLRNASRNVVDYCIWSNGSGIKYC